MKVTLRDFFGHGRLGEIGLGDTRGHVIDRLGPPDDIASGRKVTKRPKIYLYGNVEITIGPKITAENVILIGVYLWPGRYWHAGIDASDWTLTPRMPLPEFTRELEGRGFALIPDPLLTFDDQQSFFAGPARISAAFDDGLLSKLFIAPPPLSRLA